MESLLLLLILAAQDAGSGADAAQVDAIDADGGEGWEEFGFGEEDGGVPWFLDDQPLVLPKWIHQPDAGALPEIMINGDAGVTLEPIPVDGGLVDGAVVEPVALPLRSVRVRLDHPRAREEQRLTAYLGLKRGQPVDADTARLMEKRLLALGGFRDVVCSVIPRGTAADLKCGISTARVIDRYRIVGLPMLMLEREMEKRIFLRPGERLDTADPRTADRVERQRQRVEEYLQEEGVFGAKVRILTPTLKGDPRSCEVVIRIQGGKSVRVRHVEVRGAGPVDPQDVANAVRGPPWQSFHPRKLKERMDKLQLFHRAERGYPETRIRFDYKIDIKQSAADVVTLIELGPHVDIRLDNRTPRDSQDLLARMTFVDSGSVDERECAQSAANMLRYLQEHGYFDAKVTWNRVVKDKHRLAILFVATAREQGFIGTVEIRGLRGLKEDVVRDQAGLASRPRGMVLLRETPPFWDTPVVAGSKGLVLNEEVEADVKRLEQYLTGLGYTEASVRSRVKAHTDGTVQVIFDVEQGTRYLIQDVVFEGARVFTSMQLRSITSAYPGAAFVPDALDSYRERIVGAYARKGYLRAGVEVFTDFDMQGRPVLKFVIQEGKRARLRGIFIQGNQRTWEAVIRREFGVDEGTPMDPEAVAEGVGRLRRTGIFQRINARYLGVEEGREDIWALIQLEERKTRTLDGALSLSTADYLAASFEARDRNLFGLMVDTSLRLQFGPLLVPSTLLPWVLPHTPFTLDPPQRAQDLLGAQVGIRSRSFVQLGLKVPRVLGTQFNINVAGEGEIRDRPIPAGTTGGVGLRAIPRLEEGPLGIPVPTAPHREFDQERLAQFSWQVGGERPFLEWWRVQFGYQFDIFARQLAVSPDERWDLGIPTRSGAVELQLGYNRLDNPFDPRKGISVLWRGKLGARPLLAEGEYVVNSLQAEGYYTVWRLTLAGSLRTIGALVDGGAGNKRVVPRRDLGIAGGDRSVRGYDEDAIRVQRRTLRAGVDPTDPRSVVGEPGLYSSVLNLEARYALWRGLGVGDLQLAAFVDSALVTDTVSIRVIDPRRRPTEVGVGAGAGLRYVTPVGPIAIDYGFDLLHPPLGRLHLLFGYTF